MNKAFFAGAWGAIVVTTMVGTIVWLWHICAKANSARLERSKSEEKEVTVEHSALKPHLDIWLHQNTILWNRLVTISALQVPIIGGWAATLDRNVVIPIGIATLGVVLSLSVFKLVMCDLDRRDHHRTKIGVYFSKSPNGTPGYIIIEFIAALFVCVDILLILAILTRRFEL